MNQKQPAIGHVSNTNMPQAFKEIIDASKQNVKHAPISENLSKMFGEMPKETIVHIPQSKR